MEARGFSGKQTLAISKAENLFPNFFRVLIVQITADAPNHDDRIVA
jgi:hypothetical protein